LLADFTDATKQAEPGECRDVDPSYVMVGVTNDMGDYIGEDDGDDNPDVNLIEVGLKWNSSLNVWETVYSEDLALPAGDYNLEHFIVYDSEGEVLWVAPRVGGSFADYVTSPLPQPFTLTSGTKPYINVEVLCYFSRSEDAYGYVFFDITPVPVENSYCVFVDFCWDETGRDYPAHFMVEVWSDEFDGTPFMINNYMNAVDTSGDLPAASVLCFALPDLGDDTYYARLTLLDYEGAYELDPERDYIVEFTITQDDIDAQEAMVPAYTHIRYNCEPPYGEPTCPPNYPVGDWNQDCVVDCKDTNTCEPGDCVVPGDTNGDCIVDCRDTNTCDSEGCGDSAYMFGDVELTSLGLQGGQNWGWGLLVDGQGADVQYQDPNDPNRWILPFWAGAGQNDTSKAWRAGDVILELNEAGDWITITIDLYDGVTVLDTHFWFNDDNQWPEMRAPGQFDLHKDTDLLSYSFPADGTDNYTVIVHAGEVCDEDF
jgi:hypothetical protein